MISTMKQHGRSNEKKRSFGAPLFVMLHLCPTYAGRQMLLVLLVLLVLLRILVCFVASAVVLTELLRKLSVMLIVLSGFIVFVFSQCNHLPVRV
jgi:hypothetical protein